MATLPYLVLVNSGLYSTPLVLLQFEALTLVVASKDSLGMTAVEEAKGVGLLFWINDKIVEYMQAHDEM